MILLAASPIEHVVSHPLITSADGTVLLDNHMLMQIVGTIVLLGLLLPAFARRRVQPAGPIEGQVPRGPTNFFEAICNYIRNEVARPALQEHTDRFIGYIWSVFFFILTVNLLGLLPIDAILSLFGIHAHIGGTATGNIFVTATLALCTMGLMVYNGLRLGGRHYLAHFCPGPLWLAPLLVGVEILGLIAKIFALAVRLCANMMAGHILLATLVGFALFGLGVAVPAVIGAALITLLEIFVALLQAFIFTFLTCLFLGQSIVFHHDDHAHDDAHEGAH